MPRIRSREVYFINPPALPTAQALNGQSEAALWAEGVGLPNREGAGGLGTLDTRAKGFAYPPHLLATLAAGCRPSGFHPHLLDAAGHGWNARETLATMPDHEPIPVVAQVSYATREADGDFLRMMRLERPRAHVLVVGPRIRQLVEVWQAQDLADAYFLGEPEAAIGPALDYFCEECGDTLDPLQMGYTGYDEARRMVNLDDLPFPAWELVDKARYGFLTILSGRGCAEGCAFCPYVVAQGTHFRAQSPERTVAEMEWLAATHQPPHVVFRDPVFASDRNRVLAICEGIHQKGIRQTWECESRPEHFDRELLRTMKAAGCTLIKLGLETVDASLLVTLRRAPTDEAAQAYVEQTRAVVRLCQQLGITPRLFVMTGLPQQTDAMVDGTAEFLKSLDLDIIHVKPYHWYPGVALGEQTEQGERQAKRLQRLARPRLTLRDRLRGMLRR